MPADTLTYALAGGADAAFFSIDASGNLSFLAAPDYEAPADSDGNNDYVVDVSVFDGVNTTVQTLTVNVTDVVETAPPSGNGGNTGGGTDDGGDGSTDPIEPPDTPTTPDPVGDVTPNVLSTPDGDPFEFADYPDPSQPADNLNWEIADPTEPALQLDSTPTAADSAPVSLVTPPAQNVVISQLTSIAQRVRDVGAVELDGLVDTIEEFAQAAPFLPPLELSGKLLDLIDMMKQEMSDANLSDEQVLLLTSALGATLTLSVGYVAWLLRVGYLATSLMSLTPILMRNFDPLIVVAKRRKDEGADEKHETRKNDEGLNRLFDQNVYDENVQPRFTKPS